MANKRNFLFVVCQHGAEAAVKAELASAWPDFRFAYSRPGFLTFKLPSENEVPEEFDLRSTFARTHGFSLGKVDGTDAVIGARTVWEIARDLTFHHLHVWQRDWSIPGDRGFEPGITPVAEEVAKQIVAAAPNDRTPRVNQTAAQNETVLDCVLVHPNEWWIGYHRATSLASRWPGGVCPVDASAPMVSRAYRKIVEALAWSKLPIAPGETCVDIGSSPGGISQALLERDLKVIGIDPAEMEPSVLEHENFTHIRKRGADVARREFRDATWLVTDLNVAPAYTLDTAEAIATHPSIKIRGMLLTLKLPDWKLAAEIPTYIQRVQSWGYHYVKTRQLAFNRQEICLMALRQRAMRRVGRKSAEN